MMKMHFADVWEAIAGAIPDHLAVAQGGDRRSWRTYEDRAARVASLFAAHDVGADTKVALYLMNSPEYLEAQFGAFKVRAIPVNVNYRYVDEELVYLLDNADAEAVVFHASFADRVERIRDRLPRLRLLLEVDDVGAGGPTVPGALGYEQTLSAASPLPRQQRSGDDAYMLYTGGTTGLPKGVTYRIGDMVRFFLRQTSMLYGLEIASSPEHAVERALQMADARTHRPTLAGPPLMHGTGMWMGAMAPQLLGSPSVLLPGGSFDADVLLDTIARESVATLIIVGDAFARPIIEALDRRPADLSSLTILASSGAMLSAASKERLLAAAPHLTILDLLGSSEGGMGMSVTVKGVGSSTARFNLNPGVRVVTTDGADVVPGSGDIGMLMVTSEMVPTGYYKDPEKSARTFVERDGIRYALPGDMATVEADGSITLLGRGSACINTGGEKVFAEEVEEAIKTHPAIADCLVFGVDDERFGQRVVGVVTPAAASATVDIDAVLAHVTGRLSRYKVPRQLIATDESLRGPNGKADYARARAAFEGVSAS